MKNPEDLLTNSEQMALIVMICHNEWREAESRGQEEYNFDGYLPFLGWVATRICSEASQVQYD